MTRRPLGTGRLVPAAPPPPAPAGERLLPVEQVSPGGPELLADDEPGPAQPPARARRVLGAGPAESRP